MKKHIFFIFGITFACLPSLFAMEPKKWDGQSYARNSEIQYGAGMRLVAQISFKSNDAVLDIFCGNAKLAAHIAQNCVPQGTVTAVDFSESMIDQAKKEYSTIPNLCIIQKDATQLDFVDLFDKAISVFGLHWIPDLDGIKAVFEGVARSLKPCGAFVAIFTNQHEDQDPNSALRLVQNLIRSKKWATFYEGKMPLGNNLSLADYQEALAHAGLQGKVEMQPMPARALSRDQVTSFLSALPMLQDLPPELRNDFLLDLFVALEGFKNSEGLYMMTSSSAMIVANKPA